MANRLKSLLLLIFFSLSATGTGFAADKYGAIAYSPSSGAWGYWYDANSQGAANSNAMAACRKHGRGCKVVTHFHNACGAVYAGSNGWGADWGNSRNQAERKAARRCSQYTSGCRLVAWSCTSR
ncbi:hypothetical protein CSC94_15660 [Zhengella mangrovi]|uniref:DUF4189 domain-containing protein n=1 Tax=Zhengella mangrovi TaxID=1982044 RepID=A0A2G1QKI0_9HYPH|nr:DUF4189 domain-containing protein [Zhengella mangrovi]PHP66045.1 hypothetical protein CSC94_15660 [Zhengella mangrovi]